MNSRNLKVTRASVFCYDTLMSDVVKKTITSHDGLKLYYEIHGLPRLVSEAGRVIFFVHGAGGDADAWEFVRSQLLAKGFASISMDLRGHGYSAHPRHPSRYEIKHLVVDIVTILDQERIEKMILIGHSYGAVVATNFAIEHPERLEKLVIISGAHSAPNYLKSKILKKLSIGIIHALAFISPPAIGDWHSPYPKGKHHKDYELKGLVRTIFYNSWASYLLTSKQNINLDIEHKLSRIKTPTLLIVGTKDSIFPHNISRQMQALIPNSTLELIDGANHVVILNNADETVRLIENFLSNDL